MSQDFLKQYLYRSLEQQQALGLGVDDAQRHLQRPALQLQLHTNRHPRTPKLQQSRPAAHSLRAKAYSSGRILRTFDEPEVLSALHWPRQCTTRRAGCEQYALVIDKHKAGEIRRAPNQLKSDAAPKLYVRHILGRIEVAAICARRPRATLAELRKRGRFDAGPKPVAYGDAGDTVRACLIQVVGNLAKHRRCIAVVVIVECMSSISAPWCHVDQVPQPGSPKQVFPDCLPFATEVIGSEGLDPLT
mmetsp:Transcript_51111/g.101704  ORF Transcript_51111/g.101704 Transcript_51111/m.101704 type:complete len:246 (-) Transcript_51111:171-908(-)|eukprot:CAMPEP_0174731038 /NCGR_PEP_ID=MMETSP1094-20130205/56779_1 /TAXON_ID=156173 /ORGANISM="Chrysochromulina brevifilum, Strain UTEX LB 985" /LENGTH=245 /DNA_ID=CAMNT_0015933381 /DNA_START=124 /DNA_END=861 /DNA_ORIENTATION=-